MRTFPLALLLALPAVCAEVPREVPDFKLTAVTAKSVREAGKKDLLGKVWVADFVFTRCKGPCPLITRNMAALQRDLPKQVALVSFSVDPNFDKPAVLQKYGRLYRADPERWTFFTAKDEEAMIPLLKDGFKTAVRKDEASSCGFTTTHSASFVLVDAKGFIRGEYNGEDPSALKRLRADAVKLLPL